MSPVDLLSAPVIQYGFAGLCLILLGVLVWLIRRLLDLLDKTGRIIQANTDIIGDVSAQTSEVLGEIRAMNNKLLARPCIARREEGGG